MNPLEFQPAIPEGMGMTDTAPSVIDSFRPTLPPRPINQPEFLWSADDQRVAAREDESNYGPPVTTVTVAFDCRVYITVDLATGLTLTAHVQTPNVSEMSQVDDIEVTDDDLLHFVDPDTMVEALAILDRTDWTAPEWVA